MQTPRDYTGLGAEVWDVLAREHDPGDVALFRGRLDGLGPPPLRVLDVGCGTGRMMLPLLRAWHRVVGLDVSADQLRFCRARLEEAGLAGSLCAESVERYHDDEPFDAVLVPCGTLQLLDGRAGLAQGLRRIAGLLRPHGLLLASFFLEGGNLFDDPTQVGRWVLRGQGVAGDGTQLVKHARVDDIDWPAQCVRLTLRYRRCAGDDPDRVLQEQTVAVREHWYSPGEIAHLIADTGFTDVQFSGGYAERPMRASDRTFVVQAVRRADA